MRKLTAALLCTILIGGCTWFGPRDLGQVNPQARLDPEKNYEVIYWDVELPWVLDPQGVYKSKVEESVAEFCAENPGITVETQWLEWAKAEAILAKALRDGVPPDIWGDWQGLARLDHVLQIPADLWTDQELMTQAGRRSVSHEGRIWAWPRWTWPRGLLTLRSNLGLRDSEVEDLVTSRWDWQEFGSWLEKTKMNLEVNDWQGEFSTQALLAATGYGCGKWGGQELSEVFTALELLTNEGRVSGTGEYMKITGGKNILGGFTPAFVTWLAENMPEEEALLLPIPGISNEVSYIPVSSANLIQFRQMDYKGDDHSLAAAMLAEFLAVKEGMELASALWAAPAWNLSVWDGGELPSWYCKVLENSMEAGVPLYKVDSRGRAKEMAFREGISAVLEDFWAGKASSQDVAARLEEME